jgi:hypothetical protein
MITVNGKTKGLKIRFTLDAGNKLICSYSEKDFIQSFCGAGRVSTWRHCVGADLKLLASEGIDDKKLSEIEIALRSDA